MKNSLKILNAVESKGKVSLSELTEVFGTSKQYISQQLSKLIEQKKIFKIGETRGVYYLSKKFLKENEHSLPKVFTKKYLNSGVEEHKVLSNIDDIFPVIQTVPENIKSIFNFGFSEMLNNAIEHSKTKYITVSVELINSTLVFIIEDSGVGVFRNIREKKKLNTEEEAIQDLLKGKTTTMPTSHSGEGIFFTSRIADRFSLNSFGYELIVSDKDNVIDIRNVSKQKRGTKVTFSLNLKSKKHLTDIFKKYTNLTDESDHGFDKTEVRIKLYTKAGILISRSQARRVLSGLDKFSVIVFDYENVDVIGQAFADEIYRVFIARHQDITILDENVSEGVRFMIQRAKKEATVGR